MDTTNCDREAIHVPGSIQPHGLLVVFDPVSERVIAAAGDVERFLVIPDVNYVPAPILPQEIGSEIDLSDCSLRSVSPVHVQYLKNMEVSASMSVSVTARAAGTSRHLS